MMSTHKHKHTYTHTKKKPSSLYFKALLGLGKIENKGQIGPIHSILYPSHVISHIINNLHGVDCATIHKPNWIHHYLVKI